MNPGYAELHAVSAFSFRRGASMPQELVEAATALGYRALALTDECSMAGAVRGYERIRDYRECAQAHAELLVGCEWNLDDGLRCVALCEDQAGYSAVCRTITQARRATDKGAYRLTRADFDAPLPGTSLLWIPRGVNELDELAWLRERYGGRLWIAVELHRDGRDAGRLAGLQELSRRFALPLVASGDVHMHCAARRALQDVMVALRHHRPVERCGTRLFPNGERHLRTLADLQSLYPHALLAESLRVAERCAFRIEQVRYRYPKEVVGAGHTPTSWLRHLVVQRLPRRWPHGCPPAIRATIEKELALIAEKEHEPFFLTVYDIVEYARSRNILCQGRGSAANSVVCYVLGITEVDPERNQLLFERFMSRERDEEPDIDVDFEHERREEVIQYVFDKYGRDRAAIAATVIGYRTRSALRDVGRALDIGEEVVDRVAKSLAWWDDPDELGERLRAVGVDPQLPRIRRWLALAGTLIDGGFPRHLSQHVGGFVISDGPLHELVPVENAAMPDRTIIQWDKDDLETLGLLKVDVLALGMLSALRRMLEQLHAFGDDAVSYESIRDHGCDEDPDTRATYEMICRADTVGVFQIESRAQMSMLPRLRPKSMYDLTVQVAIVRPGPIQGGMVHPYLKQRHKPPETIEYPLGPGDPIRSVLGRTSGVPIFQEQVMQIAMVAAGFTASRADALRRAMAAWKRNGHVDRFREELTAGMKSRGYSDEFAARIFRQIEGFGSYGFPESHAASFALLAYKSAWLKRHRPAAFVCGLINAQPMGFYPVSMLVREAQRSGVDVRAVDVRYSRWDCHLERDAQGQAAIRLGLRLIRGFNAEAAQRLEAMRSAGPFATIDDLARRAALSARELDVLASADALQALAGHRFQARWQTRGHAHLGGVLAGADLPDEAVALAAPSEGEDVLADYQSTHLSLRRHPTALLRPRLDRHRVLPNERLRGTADGSHVRVGGIVMFRQRPGSAKGTMFITLEDDTGIVNLIVRPPLIEAQREAVVGGSFLLARGRLQKQGSDEDGWIIHVIAEEFADRSHWIARLPYLSRDFH
ncbi:error-prone DNA polymerase [Solimonas terrae]|uniref:Error-prone DNA polymerase n=1 Tax=Solimonas terrae TaxID=1396819 RepID=A0A6M2BP26_9GAMM|nr:error-prone DNA polymerase [Solimonas terrae]NGY04372.1 DNA polymerase III subunit alpha [Solimonas terrae]